MIMVFVNGGQGTMYSDSVDGKILSDTAITKELIGFVDANYRTIASREGRAVEGFSMGGFGALKLAFKYPELFSSVVSGGGALHNARSFSTRRKPLYSRMFNSQAKAFNANCPDELAKANADRIRGKVRIMMFVGSKDGTLKYNQRVHELLKNLKIAHEFNVVDFFGHNRVGLYEVLAEEVFRFHAKGFFGKPATTRPAAKIPKK